jgi:hypothetical protein
MARLSVSESNLFYNGNTLREWMAMLKVSEQICFIMARLSLSETYLIYNGNTFSK